MRAGLRIPVASVVEMVADGLSRDDILASYPDLEAEDIEEALRFAAEAVRAQQVPMTIPLDYVLLDRATCNQLGEFETLEEAEETYFRYVSGDPTAAEHLEIWHEDDGRLEVDPEKIRRVTARS
jgi:hypothetical protein